MKPVEVDIYTDGTHRNGVAAYSFVVVTNGKVIHQESGLTDSDAAKAIWQVAGELKAAMAAISWCKRNACKAIIHHDYEGVAAWAKGTWRTKNEYTRAYKQWMQNNAEYFAGFQWVKGHSGNQFNELADKLAYAALDTAVI